MALWFWLFPGPAYGQIESNLPPGFRSILSVPGIQLYQKNYSNGSPDFVQIVNLRQGAAVLPLYGTIAKPGAGQGVFGGNNPAFEKQSLPVFWKQLAQMDGQPVCITNGQFFFLSDNPTHLPFPLKKDGVVISEGYDEQNFPGQRLMLEIWPDQVQISSMTRESLYSSTAPHIIAGLAEDANKRIKQYTGRTFVGTQDQDGDGQAEILLIFNTLSARQVDAAQVLREAGATQVMMLDGGGSTQLICEGNWLVRSDRWIPQAIGIVAGITPGSSYSRAESIPATHPAPPTPTAVVPITDAVPISGAEILAEGSVSTNAANNSLIGAGSDQGEREPAVMDGSRQALSETGGDSAQTNPMLTTFQSGSLAEVYQAGYLQMELDNVIWVPMFILPTGLLVMLWVNRQRRYQENPDR